MPLGSEVPGVQGSHLLTMTADELVFFVNGKKVSRSRPLLPGKGCVSCGRGCLFFLFCDLLSLCPFKGVAAFGVTLGKEDLLRARTQSRHLGGKGVRGREARREVSELPPPCPLCAGRDTNTKPRREDRVPGEIGGHPPHFYFCI